MCRSIKTLRPPFVESVAQGDLEAAALQYVRKVAGMRKPARANEAAFSRAVEEVTAATERLLGSLRLPARNASKAAS
jgi:hypothetical protein